MPVLLFDVLHARLFAPRLSSHRARLYLALAGVIGLRGTAMAAVAVTCVSHV